MLCSFHGQAIKFKLHLEGSLLHLSFTRETSHVFVFLIWMNRLALNSRLDRCDSQDVSTALHFFALAVHFYLFCAETPNICVNM